MNLRALFYRSSIRLAPFILLFCEHLLQDHLIQRQIGHELLESAVLFLQLSQPPNLVDGHLAVPLPPHVVGCLADPELARDLQDRGPCVNLSQGRRDLLLRELFFMTALLGWRAAGYPIFLVLLVSFSGRTSQRKNVVLMAGSIYGSSHSS